MRIFAAVIEGNFFQKVITKLSLWLGAIVRYLWSMIGKVQNNKIVFMTYSNSYMCNPKYIAEELLKHSEYYDLVWICNKEQQSDIPIGIRKVKRATAEAYLEMKTAKIWVDNSLNFVWRLLHKKKSQVYFETWHGSMGLKRVGQDDVKNKNWVKIAKRCGKETSYCISDSEFENNVFRETYWPKTEILMYGHARNDILLCTDENKREEIKKKVFEFFELDENDKLLLYAPTFRDSGDTSIYDVDFLNLRIKLEEKFGGNWKILYRNHFHYRRKKFENKYEDFLIDATSYVDMQELLLAVDVGLSDYSSWLCDFVLTRKPAFIYASDLKDYNTERGLYYPLETTPFPIATNNDELINNIMNFNNELYLKKCEEFLKDKGCVEDGHAAERVVQKINEIIGVTYD